MGNTQGSIADGQLAAALQQGDVTPLLQQLRHHNRKIGKIRGRPPKLTAHA
jgi:hypothetical protein